MSWIKNLVLILVLIALIDSCIKQPEYKVVPEISSLNISFQRPTNPSANPTNADTLSFTVAFKDGNGDLGINSDETTVNSTDVSSPWYYVYDTIQNQIVGYTDSSNVNWKKYNISNNTAYTYLNSIAISQHLVQSADTFPAINCSNWQTISNGDIVYIKKNMNAYNFTVKAYIKDAGGNYTTPYLTPGSAQGFPSCAPDLQGLDGRFPVLSSELGKSSPMDGTLTYNFVSADIGFYPNVTKKTIKFDVHITDRAFHESNVLSTEYTFP